MPIKLTRKEKESLLNKVIGNKVRISKTAHICYICPNEDKDIDIIEKGESVVDIGIKRRVAHAKHFKLAVIGVK